MENKVKFYKNIDRGKPEQVKKFVPNYKRYGREPDPMQTHTVPNNHPVSRGSTVNPREPKPMFNLPNVGNNMDHTWAGVDNQIVDDLNLDPQTPMIDNNQLMSHQALGYVSTNNVIEVEENSHSNNTYNNSPLNLNTVLQDLDSDLYLILIGGVPFASGNLLDIQVQVNSLAFGEHPEYQGKSISLDHILVIKKIKINAGIFLG